MNIEESGRKGGGGAGINDSDDDASSFNSVEQSNDDRKVPLLQRGLTKDFTPESVEDGYDKDAILDTAEEYSLSDEEDDDF